MGCEGDIFDCDDMLVESSEAHYRAMQTAAAAQGFSIARDWYEARTGLDRRSLFNELQSDVAASVDVNQAVDDSISAFALHKALVQPIAETGLLLDALKASGYRIAVATNAERSVALQSLTAVGHADKVDALVSITDGVPPKPSPSLFELAAERLGLGPDALCVIEDSPQGVAAALAAGMPVFQVQPGA